MRANRATSTGPETALRSALWTSGARGFRVNYQGIPGRPDIVFPTKNLAVFVNGCFWHRCPRHDRSLPKSHTDYWKLKFELNRLRDERKVKELRLMGWTTLVVWECELRTNEKMCVARIRSSLDSLNPVGPRARRKHIG
jgi:DNA mismatch endonuclease, patch repair protein